MTKKNGSKKRDKRNVKKMQENLTEAFSALTFSEVDNLQHVENGEEQIEAKLLEKVGSKMETMSWELAGTSQMDIRFRNRKESEDQ